MTAIDHRRLALPRGHRTPEDVIIDRGLTLLLALLVATGAARADIEPYHDTLEQRATQGAKQGDC